MGRLDINDYANSLLLDFLDAFHDQLKADLIELFGDDWLAAGVQRHMPPDYFDRTRKMLESPMRVVDMGKTDEELFGVEHLSNIVTGNWKTLYKDRFQDQHRTQVYLQEVAEVRHNVSHRRRRHVLRRAELARFTHNCAVLLRCIGSSRAAEFERAADSLAAGATPWGSRLPGYLPPQDDVVDEFVGRKPQLDDLGAWLAGSTPQLLVWGYGGAGKSALAYEFARETKETAPSPLCGVAWVSAKSREYVIGREQERRADFDDTESLIRAIFQAVYEVEIGDDPLASADLLAHLRDTPILLVVDDFDTVLKDHDLVEFLMYELRGTGSRVLYTSRQDVAGLRSVEVLGFDGDELREFVRVRAPVHELSAEPCLKRLKAIESVTGSFPLFVDDLLRYARLTGIDDALGAWGQRKGDAAREYALRRQLEQLGDISKDVLMALAISNGPLTTIELATLAGVTDDDAEHAVGTLQDWRLVSRVPNPEETRARFDVNSNTARLVQRTYAKEPRMEVFRSKSKALKSGRVPAARTVAVSSAIGIARSFVIRGDVETAIEELKTRMTGDLTDSAELFGALGWVYSRRPSLYLDEAREAFERARDLGNTKEDTFYHWASMERDQAEESLGRVRDEELLDIWRRCAATAEFGIRVCGATRALCQLAGYARTRQGKTLDRLNQFMQAHGAYAEAAHWLQKALTAPGSTVRDVPRGQIYRGLALAQEGMRDVPGLQTTLEEWRGFAGEDEFFLRECGRLCQQIPELRAAMA